MKKIKLVPVFALLFCKPIAGLPQTINWGNIKEGQRQFININAGVEYGVIFGGGYGYRLKSRIPVIINTEYSFPSGKRLFDDFKTKAGGQVRFYKAGNFNFSAKLYGVFRRYESDFARLLNFGSDLSATAGYYKAKWFVEGEAGFDKAIVTHFKHQDSYKAIYPLVKDGWYGPSTGGNFYYNLQTGYSFRRHDLYLKADKIINQDFQTAPLVPFSLQVGFTWKIGQ